MPSSESRILTRASYIAAAVESFSTTTRMSDFGCNAVAISTSRQFRFGANSSFCRPESTIPGTLTPITAGARPARCIIRSSIRSRAILSAVSGFAGVSKSVSSVISPRRLIRPTWDRRTPRLTPMKYLLSAANDSTLRRRPVSRPSSLASTRTPLVISGLTFSVTVLLSIRNRSAISVRVTGWEARI